MISSITKRKILKLLRERWEHVFGELNEREFISMIYDVDRIPSSNWRFKSFYGDYHQHRINNYDWEDNRRLFDERTWIMFVEDDTLFRLLEIIVHPQCRLDKDEILYYKRIINETIFSDGYMLSVDKQESWYNIYKIIEISKNPLHIPENAFDFDNTTDYYKKIVYAKNLFWNVWSSPDEKKSAIKELVDILEALRDDFPKLQLSKDENDLFQIANTYAIRHANKSQKPDYDQEIFYDFIFILYLNQIKLIENLNWKS